MKENIAPLEIPQIETFDGPGINGSYVYEQETIKGLDKLPAMTGGRAESWSAFFRNALRSYATEGVFDSRKAYLSMVADSMALHAGFAPYDQYEVAVPLVNAGTCLKKIQEAVYGPEKLYEVRLYTFNHCCFVCLMYQWYDLCRDFEHRH